MCSLAERQLFNKRLQLSKMSCLGMASTSWLLFWLEFWPPACRTCLKAPSKGCGAGCCVSWCHSSAEVLLDVAQAGVVRNSGQNWTSDRGGTCGWQEPGHKGSCTKCMVDADTKRSLLSMEEGLGRWRARISSDLLLGRKMREPWLPGDCRSCALLELG